ncbi:hypothetical protein HHK36_011337 [Tetracentron sinense]|uniref:XS domain-containing protein n=1 Tax=Tetracentron sinense TaxID=13715 RepID=A0A834ZG41_TETSI|nr:hypothetical protein HHK36_011337 [Tetracentron sinense]
MRSRRPGDVRTRSPPPKMREQRSEWRPDPYSLTHRDKREDRPPCSLQSLSPSKLERSRQILGRDGRSASVERRDYARHLDGGGRSDRVRSRSPSVGKLGNRSQFDKGLSHRDSFSMEFRSKYLSDLNGDPNLRLQHFSGYGLDSSRINKEKVIQGSGSSARNGHGILLQKSMPMEDGMVRTFFGLPPDGPTIKYGQIDRDFESSASRNLSRGFLKDEDLRCRDRDHLHPDKLSAKESYNEEEKVSFYSRDVSFPIMPASQLKAFASTSSGISKGDFLGSYCDGLRLPSDGFGGSGGKFTDPFGCDGHGQSLRDPELRQNDLTCYQRSPPNPVRGEPRDYIYPELVRRERSDLGYIADELYRRVSPNDRVDYVHSNVLRPSVMDHVIKSVDGNENSRGNLRERALWDHRSLQEQPVSDYPDMNQTSHAANQDGEYLGSRSAHLDFERRLSRDREISHPVVDYGFGRDAGPGFYKDRLRSLPMSEGDPDLYIPKKQRLIGIYEPSERVLKREYDMGEEMSRHNPRCMLSSNWNSSSEVQDLGDNNKQLIGEDMGGLSLSKKLGFVHTRYRNAGRTFDGMVHYRVSASDDWLSSQDQPVQLHGNSSEHHRSAGRDIKRRLRPRPPNFHNSYLLDTKKIHKPYKFGKKSQDGHHGGVNVHDVDPSEDGMIPAKSDPPEDSEEFKQMVHKAFFKFSKYLNVNPSHRRLYKEQGKAGNLTCIVCGSLSKEFVDTRRLVTHAYMSLKVGLRAQHLGYHKALCVLMGWNVAPLDNSMWVHRVLPNAESLALKEDLILWPPLVIIHNSSILNNDPDGRKMVTIDVLEAILRGPSYGKVYKKADMSLWSLCKVVDPSFDRGFGGGKAKVCRGKPADQSIMVVKFLGTFSGLQEAERLHKYYAENKRGRVEFQQITSNSGSGEAGRMQADNLELVLYGHMGIAEDLDKLDFETKKRCVVKSKKDIQDIADAPLKPE